MPYHVYVLRNPTRGPLHATAVIAVGLIAALAMACSDDDDMDGGEEDSGEQEVHWSYEGATGPENWSELSAEFETCSSGVEQSPISIPSNAPPNSSGLTVEYRPSMLTILNNGHTIQVNYDTGSEITIDGKTYELVQFHFHIPSENELAGEGSEMELHFVHTSADAAIAVIGVLMDEGAENAALADVWANLPEEEAEAHTVEGVTLDAADMLPDTQEYFKFDGSLTTPPCTEGVTWLVMQSPVAISREQINAFEEIVARNARPVQPLNDRMFD